MAKLTDQFIRSLQAPESAKDVQVFDDSLPGFGVKQASGLLEIGSARGLVPSTEHC